jgi:hypothetical protein
VNQFRSIIPSVVCAAGSLLASTACLAQDAPRTCNGVTGFERRIVEHADQDIENLRGFVWSRRAVSGINMQDVKESLDTWRAAVVCQKQVAAAAAAAQVATQAHEPSQEVATAGR